MEVSGQLHVPAALPPVNKPCTYSVWCSLWPTDSLGLLKETKISLCLSGFKSWTVQLVKVKQSHYSPAQAPSGSRKLKYPEVLDSRLMKVARLSAKRTGHLYPQEISLVLVSVRV